MRLIKKVNPSIRPLENSTSGFSLLGVMVIAATVAAIAIPMTQMLTNTSRFMAGVSQKSDIDSFWNDAISTLSDPTLCPAVLNSGLIPNSLNNSPSTVPVSGTLKLPSNTDWITVGDTSTPLIGPKKNLRVSSMSLSPSMTANNLWTLTATIAPISRGGSSSAPLKRSVDLIITQNTNGRIQTCSAMVQAEATCTAVSGTWNAASASCNYNYCTLFGGTTNPSGGCSPLSSPPSPSPSPVSCASPTTGQDYCTCLGLTWNGTQQACVRAPDYTQQCLNAGGTPAGMLCRFSQTVDVNVAFTCQNGWNTTNGNLTLNETKAETQRTCDGSDLTVPFPYGNGQISTTPCTTPIKPLNESAPSSCTYYKSGYLVTTGLRRVSGTCYSKGYVYCLPPN